MSLSNVHCKTSIYLHLPYHCITPKDDEITTLYTLWTTTSDTIARNSSEHTGMRLCMPTVPNSEAEILNNLKHP